MDVQRPLPSPPIPSHAKEVFKGQIFSVYQWEQEMFNGTKAIFEKLRRADTVSVIPITSDGKIVLGRQQQPGGEEFIGVFGGRLDGDEDPLTAAKRELLEESGLEAENVILWDARQPITKIDWAIYTFIAKGCRKVMEQHLDAGEKIEMEYVDLDIFIKIVSGDNFRDIEVALKVLKLASSPSGIAEMKKLFFD